jgi:hypothetical protein
MGARQPRRKPYSRSSSPCALKVRTGRLGQHQQPTRHSNLRIHIAAIETYAAGNLHVNYL